MQFLIVFSVLFSIIEVSLSAPTKYDQRQDGKVNVHAKLENFLIIIAPSSSGLTDPSSGSNSVELSFPGVLAEAFDFKRNLLKSVAKEDKKDHLGFTSDKEILSQSIDDQDITHSDPSNKVNGEEIQNTDELKLVGDAIENCGPGRRRDRFGICQSDSAFEN